MKKRILAILTSAALLLCGCGKGSRTGATLEVDLTHSYASEVLDMNGMRVVPIAVTDQGVIMEHQKNPDVQLFLYNPTEDTFKEIETSQTNPPACFTQLPDGRLAAMYDVITGRKRGKNVYDGKTRMLEIYDSNLQVEETRYFGEDVPKFFLYDSTLMMDGNGYWYMLACDEDGFYTLTVLYPDLTVKGTIPLDSMICEQLVTGTSGTVYALMTALSGEQYAEYNNFQTYRLDAETMTKERLTDFEIPADIEQLMEGSTDYELYYSDKNGIYGVNENGTAELHVDFMNSDFPDDTSECWTLPDGEFILHYTDEESFTSGYYRLRPRTEEEIEQIQVISLAGVNLSHSLIQDVCKYNQSQTDYRIVMKDYAEDCPEGEYPANVFNDALLNGTVPDIICMDGLPYQQLSSKGLLTDFAPMLEAEERFDPEQYYMNILEGMEHAGKLERIGFSFVITTAAAKTEFVGEQQGRTPEEYMDMIRSLPEGMQLLPIPSRESILYYYLFGSQSAFIDRNTKTSHFTDASFVQLLELANSLQPEEELYTTDEEFWEQISYAYEENHTLLEILDIQKPITLHLTRVNTFQNEDITLVGFPDADGGNGGKYRMNYTIALTSRSDKVEPVWEFIMGELSSIRQSKKCLDRNTYDGDSLPIMRNTLHNCMIAATVGVRHGGNATEQEMETLETYVEQLRRYEEYDSFITNIIAEEAGMYFSGDQTAERAAEMIQSRVNLYLSEQE